MFIDPDEPLVMPLATRLPEADKGDVTAAGCPAAGWRLGGGHVGMPAPSIEDLLPAIDARSRDPVPAPARALAPDAIRLLRLWGAPASRPARWSSDAFREEVDRVRSDLAPVRTRRSLAASFAREAFQRIRPADGPVDASAVRVAYAIRWRELGQ